MSVAAAFLLGSEPRQFVEHTRMPTALLHTPHGLSWFVSLPPALAAVSSMLVAAFFVSAIFLLVGLYTRLSAIVLLVVGFVVLGAAQLTGAVLHDMHLLWFVALLACARSGDALSLDAWFRAPKTQPHWRRFLGSHQATTEAGLVLVFARTLLGILYFFPGFHKVQTSGLAWALSDNLANQMQAKWMENGELPFFRIDHHPWLLATMGLATLAFELSFIVLVHAGRRARIGLGLFGLVFHLGIHLFMFIPFASIWLCYTCLGSSRTASPVSWSTSETRMALRRAAPLLVVGAVLVLANAERGVRGDTQAFPFACYPTFAERAADTLPDLRAVAEDPSGALVELPLGRDEQGRRTQEQWGQAWSVAGLYGAPFSMQRFESYLRAETARPNVARSMQHARIVHVERVFVRVAPEARGEPPTRTEMLGALDVSDGRFTTVR